MLSNPHFHPHFIVLDPNIPNMSGSALLERWKENRIPVVVFSSSMNPGVSELSLASGAREFVTKPVELEGFQEAVGRIGEQWESRAASARTHGARARREFIP